MLNPHECATLVLVQDAPAEIDMEREQGDFGTLLARRLVRLERTGEEGRQPILSEQGQTLLEKFDAHDHARGGLPLPHRPRSRLPGVIAGNRTSSHGAAAWSMPPHASSIDQGSTSARLKFSALSLYEKTSP
ncbi:hypothetical protein [Paraburkholderia mimosarum]|uniref:hypothetical protein n=1 Tax=Paraburkholderia mimosarum TaxID=312026 RepID=UPI001FC84FA0|nr:hypothetical protein [Paraburkholderia mimosarum]